MYVQKLPIPLYTLVTGSYVIRVYLLISLEITEFVIQDKFQ